MKTNNVIELIKTDTITIPSCLLKYYKDLNLTEKELIFLSFLMSRGDKIIFDVESFSKKTNFSINEIMLMIASLTEKKLISMKVIDKKEYLDVDDLYLKITDFIIDNNSSMEEEILNDKENIYETIEKEFGRTLSPIEYETIKGWLDANISEEMIIEALKETILNGVNNLKYIDRILYVWNKKGYKKPSDIKRKKDAKEKEESIDFFEYDWLDDNE